MASEEKGLVVIDYAPVDAKTMQAQVNAIQDAMRSVMKEGTHYGKVPGCGDKPALHKPGAEKLGLMFRLRPTIAIDERHLENGHREYQIICSLLDMSGSIVGQGVGSCSTLESKYRWRNAERACPTCGKSALIKSTDFQTKEANGWLCYGKKGGCGARFPLGSPDIEGQIVGRVENTDIADQYNTVLKMAKKRAHVDAILTTTAASDIFTQDIEDLPDSALPPKAFEHQARVVPADTLSESRKQLAEIDREEAHSKAKFVYDAKLIVKAIGADKWPETWKKARAEYSCTHAGSEVFCERRVEGWDQFCTKQPEDSGDPYDCLGDLPDLISKTEAA